MPIELRSAFEASQAIIDLGDTLRETSEEGPAQASGSEALTKLATKLTTVELTRDNYLVEVMKVWNLHPMVYTSFPRMFEKLLALKNTQIREAMSQMVVYQWGVLTQSEGCSNREMIADARKAVETCLNPST